MSRRRLILFVEGEGDIGAVTALTKRLITQIDAWDAVFLDPNAFKVGGVENLTGRNTTNWHNKLKATMKRRNVGGILLLLDGDRKHVMAGKSLSKQPFCAADVARRLAEEARVVGAGSTFSVACVFARQEFESWLLAGIESLCGKKLPDGRAGVQDSARLPEQDTDESPRDAKKWLSQRMERGYKPTTDQEPLTQLVSLEAIRACGPRSFRRFESAVREICEAIKSGDHVATPGPAAREHSEEQILYFRARRGWLTAPGAPDVAAAARAMIGAQSQQLNPSLLALSMRMKDRPTARELKAKLLEPPRVVVRTWGQRDTLHIFDPNDWELIVAARGEWAPGGRRGAMPPEALIEKAGEVLRSASGPLARRDLQSILPASYLRAAEEKVGPGPAARQLAAGRLFWCLAHRGEVCMADKVGAEQTYVAREHWFRKLKWPRPPTAPRQAATALARRYLSTYGPATARDLAHFFGARVSSANEWLETLNKDGELTPVSCGDRRGLVALTADIPDLSVKPPRTAEKWPLRLLPLWETLLMAHADKSWTTPIEADRKLVWRKSAFVAAVVLARGRVVATWIHKERRGRLAVEVSPLSEWNKSKHAAGVRREAKAVADHLELDDADVEIGRD